MEEFITLNNIILNKKCVKTCIIKKDVKHTTDLDYEDGWRPTDIHIKILTFDGDEYNTIVLDDDWNDFVNFIGILYNLDEYESKRKLAAHILSKAEINERKYTEDKEY